MQQKIDQARAEFISEANQLINQLTVEIDKKKPSYISKAFKRLRLIVIGGKKRD